MIIIKTTKTNEKPGRVGNTKERYLCKIVLSMNLNPCQNFASEKWYLLLYFELDKDKRGKL